MISGKLIALAVAAAGAVVTTVVGHTIKKSIHMMKMGLMHMDSIKRALIGKDIIKKDMTEADIMLKATM